MAQWKSHRRHSWLYLSWIRNDGDNMKGTVLLFGFDEKELAALRRALLPIRLAVKVPGAEELSLPIGSLAGACSPPDKPESEEQGPIGKMAVMAGVSQSEMDMILVSMRKAGFGRDVLKAVLTPTNMSWTAGELYGEILKEHRQMTK